jgi:DNA polymerase I
MNFEWMTSEVEIANLITWHNTNSPYVVLDTETTSLNEREAKIVHIQISGEDPDHVVMFPGAQAHLLSQLRCKAILQNFKYDWKVLHYNDVDMQCPVVDTMLLSHLSDENRESHSLDSWVQELFGDNYKQVFWSKYKSYTEAPFEEQLHYACLDILYTNKVYEHLQEVLGRQKILPSLIDHVHNLALSLVQTEMDGIAIDLEYLTNKGVEVKGKLESLTPKMRASVDLECQTIEMKNYMVELDKRKTEKGKANVPMPVFSFDSSKQVMDLLYNELKLPPQKNDKTKQISVDYDSLEKIKDRHPVVEMIQQGRELTKVYGSYIEGTLERMVGGRIYPTFNVNGTKTGRISHSNPNLGQLPASGGIRGIYVPDEGEVFISADYSMLEVVLEANLTGDANLAKICLEGLSKHDITSKELGIDRNLAKTLNFALQYHCSHFKVAKILGINEKEGLKVTNRYWDIYSGCRDLKKHTDGMVNRGEPIVSMFGRQRRFARGARPIWSGDYRQAYNFIIQSPGADFTSRALYLADQELREKGLGRVLFSVHDELIIAAKKTHWQEAQDILLSIMVYVGDEKNLRIPLKAQPSGPQDRWSD